MALCENFEISQLAIPSVSVLIAFLAYTSQYFFYCFESAPLRKDEIWTINIFALCIWICYFRACFVDPGRLPENWKVASVDKRGQDQASARRWCRRCEAFKPPRAHHCKTCQRCIPKMDHHCPWTTNCVSHFTFPHFIRFLFYTVAGMSYLETCLWERVSIVWENRNMPSYLGPSLGQLAHLFVLFVLNSFTLFMLFILLVRSLYSMALNTTTIESWEIERHVTLVRRARVMGGYLEGPGGVKIRIRKQEFPYDMSFWTNIKDGMGGSPNDPQLIEAYSSARDTVEAFQRRQAEDLRCKNLSAEIQRRKRFHERLAKEDYKSDDERGPGPTYGDNSDEGEESWRNADGERLRDFGVDEDVEFYDEDDVPLAVLMDRRRQHND
ncbi:Palmitoyltransferase pfa4 [Penicillium chermesinum]|uniref:Palmitoyltransferase PFA4 n=1 Tax=Penicillium chermesinum TaxID=63820 RepID=A0A9W9TQ18_9EURO|nr:Palmitoyltransferase pfa4 [Penicillium chermesinum]KAJ5232854.1 Palmitoyltransferase pfa4 [Penicillium chermesinum]